MARNSLLDEVLLHQGSTQTDGEIFLMNVDRGDVRQLTGNPFEDATRVDAVLTVEPVCISFVAVKHKRSCRRVDARREAPVAGGFSRRDCKIAPL